MKEETFKRCVYIILFILIMIVFTKDINFFGTNFYEDIKPIEHPESIQVLVNKNNQLAMDYIPSDLEQISLNYAIEGQYLKKEAKEKFEQLSKDASELGYQIIASSTYRSYAYQSQLYEYYIKTKGLEYADLCSARPGHSEHQTGLAVDVMGSNHDYDQFELSVEFPWMKENAYQYGFILRYPKGKENITGFKYEPWHYRYVGVELAKLLYENNWTLDEYYQEHHI